MEELLTTAQLARYIGIKTSELIDCLVPKGWVIYENGQYILTQSGQKAGGIMKKGSFGFFILWPKNIQFD